MDNLFHHEDKEVVGKTFPRFVKTLIAEVLVICREDDTGVTLDLIEPAYRAAIEIGMTQEEIQELAER